MKDKELYDAITNVPDDLIVEAGNNKLKRKIPVWKYGVVAAACLGLVIGIVLNFFPDNKVTFHENKIALKAIREVTSPKVYSFNDYDTRQVVMESNPVKDVFIDGLNQFAYKTTAELASKEEGNLNYSPLSLYFALTIATVGANGQTEEELMKLLEVPDRDTLLKQAGNLYRLLYMENEIAQCKIANSLWMDESVSWKNKFIEEVGKNLYATVYSADFSSSATAKAMGNWIAKNTNGTLEPDIKVTDDQILSILNTVYFYDEWTDRFDSKNTKEDMFYLSNGEKVSCDYMNKIYASAGFVKGDGYTLSSLGLKNQGKMTFILPDEGVSVYELLSSPQKIEEMLKNDNGKSGKVTWQVPKLSFGDSFELSDTLKSLGVTSAFDKDADFSNITDNMSYISSIKQETHIGIDEKGVEASAYTQIDYCGGAMPEDEAFMILNRPFIYVITSPYGANLFIGICDNPTLSE